jgi:hypothetical protein
MRWFTGLAGLAAALGLAGCIDDAAGQDPARREGGGDMAAVTSPATARLLDDERPVRVATATFALG